MKIEVLTSLYPGPPRPFEGIFAERRWVGMSARGHLVRITHPLPRTPGPLARGSWSEIRRMPRREERQGLRIDRPRYWHVPGNARPNAKRFARAGAGTILARGRPDVVVADYAWPASAVAPLLVAAGVPLVINGRGSDVLQVAGEAGLRDDLARHLRAAGNWCAVSQDLVDTMNELGGADRGALVPNGVDLSQFRIRDRGAARRELGLAADGPLVLVVGHLIERKDPLLSLEVFARGAPPSGICRFVGRGPLRAELERAVLEQGLGSRVELVGEVRPERLEAWYGAADVLLLTSRREGRPNVVLEAMACGRAVLATPAGGTAELLRGLEERCLAPDRDPAGLGRMLSTLLANPPAPEELRRAVAPFSWESGLDALETFLQEVLKGGSA